MYHNLWRIRMCLVVHRTSVYYKKQQFSWLGSVSFWKYPFLQTCSKIAVQYEWLSNWSWYTSIHVCMYMYVFISEPIRRHETWETGYHWFVLCTFCIGMYLLDIIGNIIFHNVFFGLRNWCLNKCITSLLYVFLTLVLWSRQRFHFKIVRFWREDLLMNSS